MEPSASSGIQMIADIVRGACWVQWGLFARPPEVAGLPHPRAPRRPLCAIIGVTAVVLIPRIGLVGAAYGFLVGYVYNLFLSAWLNTRVRASDQLSRNLDDAGLRGDRGVCPRDDDAVAVDELADGGGGRVLGTWKVGLVAAAIERILPRLQRAGAWASTKRAA